MLSLAKMLEILEWALLALAVILMLVSIYGAEEWSDSVLDALTVASWVCFFAFMILEIIAANIREEHSIVTAFHMLGLAGAAVVGALLVHDRRS